MGIALPLGVGASGTPPAGDFANAVVSGTLTAVGPGLPFEFLGPMNIAFWASINTTLTTTNGSTAATAASGTGLAAGAAINSVNVPRGTTIGTIVGTAVTLALPTITLNGTVSTLTNVVTGILKTDGLVGSAVAGDGIPAGATVSAIVIPSVPASLNIPAQPGSIQLSLTPTANSPNTGSMQTSLRFALTGNAVTTGADSAATFTGAGITYSGTIQIERSFNGGATWLPCNVGGSGTIASYAAGTPVSLSFGEPERNIAYRLNCLAYTSGTINYRMSATGQAATALSIPSVI